MAKNFTSASGFMFQPAQTSIADFNAQQEQLDAGRRQEKRQQDQFQYLKDENYQRRIDSFLKDNKSSFENISVKNADLQTFYSNNAYGAMEEIGLLNNELRNESRDKRLDPERMAKITSLNNSVEYLKGITTSFTPIIDQINSGQVHDSPELRALLGDVRNIKVDFKTGYPRVALKSENENVKYVGIEELSRGIEGLKLVPKADVIKGWDEFTNEIKASVNTTDKNYMKTETTGVPPEVAERMAENYVFGKGGTIPNGVKSYLYENNFDPYTSLESQPGAKEALIKLQETLAERLINTKANGVKEDFDWSAKQGTDRNAETARNNSFNRGMRSKEFDYKKEKDARDGANKNGSLRGTYVNETEGSNLSPGDSTVYSFVLPKPINTRGLKSNKGESLVDASILSYRYDSKGNMVYKVEHKEKQFDKYKKSETVTKVSEVKADKASEARIAGLLNSTPDEIRQDFYKNTEGEESTNIDTSKY